MAQEAYFNSKVELAIAHIVPNDRNGGFLEYSSSGIFPRDEGHASQVHLPFSIVKMAELNASLASGVEDSTLLDKFMNPGSGVGINSLVADANLMSSSGAFLQRSSNDSIDYLNLPLSPKSLLSGNLSNNSATDVSLAPQQNSVPDQNKQLGRKTQLRKSRGSAPLTESKLQNNPFSLATGIKQDSDTLFQMPKKQRIDANPDVSQEQIVQQLLPRQDSMQLQDHHPQLRASIQHHKQQILDSLPQFCGVQAQQSEQQFSHNLQQQENCLAPSGDDGVCSQRIQSLFNLKNRPLDNSIDFWWKIVSNFYAPCAKERWCLSSYKNIGQHALGIPSLGAVGACCDLCGSGSRKGFEASFEVLPRLWKIKFESGVLEEILYLGFPRERRLPSGAMLLEYERAVQQSVYEQFRVIHEGKLRVTFRKDLKILSWEFCASHHDEYLLRKSIAPQVNQLMCVAQQYKGMHSVETSEDKVPEEKLQASCDMFAKAGNQFANGLELPTVNELGFSKRYVRCMQIAEVLNIMKDLMTFSLNQKLGPIESMHAYCHQRSTTNQKSIKMEEQEKSREGTIQNVLNSGNRSTGRSTGLGNNFNNNGSTDDRAEDLELLLVNYYQKIRESLINPRTTVVKQDQSYLTDTANQRASSPSILSQQLPGPGLFHDPLLTGLPSPRSSEASKNIQQCVVDKLLQNTLGKQKEEAFSDTSEIIFSGLPTTAQCSNIIINGPVLGNSTTSTLWQANPFANVRGNIESSRATSSSDSLKVANSSNMRIIRETDVLELPMPEGMHGQLSKN